MPALRTLSLAIVLVLSGAAFGQAEWRPVTSEELGANAPVVEPGADAEALFWEIKIDERKGDDLRFYHYLRVKIFTERGREKFSKVELPYFERIKIDEIAARVIKPDGSILNLAQTDIFDREIIRTGKFAFRAKSFAVPGIENGAILEYQYREKFEDASVFGRQLSFQQDFPIRKITYLVRPDKGMNYKIVWRNMPEGEFVKADKGFFSATAENIPAFRSEPQMPPERDVRRWAFVTDYRQQYGWAIYSSIILSAFKSALSGDESIRNKARELTASLTDDEAKLRAIYEFVQKEIRNTSYDKAISQKESSDSGTQRSSDVLKSRAGTRFEIDSLFAAMVRSIGMSVELVLSGDRSETLDDPRTISDFRALHWAGISVTNQGGTIVCNPGTPYLPFGVLDWFEEGVWAMYLGEKSSRWVKTPSSDIDRNFSLRSAKLKLGEDGALEGSVRVEHHGQQAWSRIRDFFTRTPAERESIIIESWKSVLPGAEIGNVVFDGFGEPNKPYVYRFDVKVPNFAQKTGKRMFFQPNFFQFGKLPVFASENRKYPIYFDYPWKENDTVEIELPKGYEPDNMRDPQTVDETRDLGKLVIHYVYDPAKNTLVAKREFYFGTKGRIFFPVAAYAPLKTLFDLFHKSDTSVFSLKQKQ